MTDIILFRPKENYSKNILNYRTPLGLIYVATALQAEGFNTIIIDTETTPDWKNKLKSELNKNIIFVGIGVMTGFQIKGALEFSKEIKKNYKEIPILWGGLHPSLLPEETIKHNLIDIIVIGDGEKITVDIAKHLKEGKSLNKILNIAFKKDGKIIITKKNTDFIDMEKIKIPDFNLIDIDHYIEQERKFIDGKIRCLDINTDRGCPYRCGFCYNIIYNKRKWRGISAERIIKIIKHLKVKYKINSINFTSDNFFVNKDRVRKICEGIINNNLNLTWQADIRIDAFLNYEEELLFLLKKSGCIKLTFGVESGSNKILTLIDKDINTEDIINAHLKVQKIGFKVNYHFMIGFPEETKDDMKKTIELMYYLIKSYEYTNIYGPSIYIPYPGTPLFKRAIELGFTPPENLEDWIKYDFDQNSKFKWFSYLDNRFFKEIQTIIKISTVSKTSFLKKLLRIYGRFRLFLIKSGISFFDLDTSIARYLYSKQ